MERYDRMKGTRQHFTVARVEPSAPDVVSHGVWSYVWLAAEHRAAPIRLACQAANTSLHEGDVVAVTGWDVTSIEVERIRDGARYKLVIPHDADNIL